jgi:hypothetical protein
MGVLTLVTDQPLLVNVKLNSLSVPKLEEKESGMNFIEFVNCEIRSD